MVRFSQNGVKVWLGSGYLYQELGARGSPLPGMKELLTRKNVPVMSPEFELKYSCPNVNMVKKGPSPILTISPILMNFSRVSNPPNTGFN